MVSKRCQKRGNTVADICRILNLKPRAVHRLIKQERETGDITPKTHLRGRKPVLTSEQLESLKQLILSDPDITLAEMKDTLGLPLSISAISRIVNDKLDFRYKKKHYMPANNTVKM